MRSLSFLLALSLLLAGYGPAQADEPFKLGVQKQVLSTEAVQEQLQGGAQAQLRGGIPLNGLRLSRDAAKPLTGTVFAKSLAQYNVEIVVDESLSMRKRDCPGGLSRWEWCGWQLQNLSDQMAAFAPRGFTLTTFAGGFQTYRNATGSDLKELFANPDFTPGTRLSAPLDARFRDYFSSRNANPGTKPLLLVVITDGVPHPRREPYMVAQALINASNAVRHSKEVQVVFFQIGGTDRMGRFFLDEMDNALVQNGARNDIVNVVSFEELQRVGLTRALISTVSNYAAQK